MRVNVYIIDMVYGLAQCWRHWNQHTKILGKIPNIYNLNAWLFIFVSNSYCMPNVKCYIVELYIALNLNKCSWKLYDFPFFFFFFKFAIGFCILARFISVFCCYVIKNRIVFIVDWSGDDLCETRYLKSLLSGVTWGKNIIGKCVKIHQTIFRWINVYMKINQEWKEIMKTKSDSIKAVNAILLSESILSTFQFVSFIFSSSLLFLRCSG